MNKYRSFQAVSLLVALLALTGCMRREPNLATLTPDDLFNRGVAAFEERQFERAINHLETFVLQYLGDPRAPRARLLLGEAHMERREFVTAATHFQRLIQDFPQSPLQLQARYSICVSYVRLAPRAQLDQEYTHSAIAHCESVANLYPQAEEGRVAARHVIDLRNTLAQKTFETGMFYMRRRAFDAAVVYFTDVVERFPRTEPAPAALARLVETYTRLGYVEDADEARTRLLRDYPTSPEAQALRG